MESFEMGLCGLKEGSAIDDNDDDDAAAASMGHGFEDQLSLGI